MCAMHVNEDQAALWNGPAGHAWVDTQEFLDRVFAPFATLLVEAAVERSAVRVLDVGCGTGGTTLAIAAALPAAGHAVGLDISEPMIAAARGREQGERARASFVCADAQRHTFAGPPFDLVVSRFGVMFFDDPVRAFASLRGAVRAGGDLAVIAWRGAHENPFMTAAEHAAAPFLPDLPPRMPNAPGQFAFADAQRVRGILEASGWSGVAIEPLNVACAFAARDLDRYLTRLGPVGRALADVDAATRERVIEAARSAFEPYVHGNEVRFTAACWMITARSGVASAGVATS